MISWQTPTVTTMLEISDAVIVEIENSASICSWCERLWRLLGIIREAIDKILNVSLTVRFNNNPQLLLYCIVVTRWFVWY